MGNVDLSRHRLANQLIAEPRFTRASEVVAWLGAIQAQDFTGAKWSIGLRLPEATERDIEQAIAERTIVRTWPMRGTLHFVAAEDVHWMRALLTPRVIAGSVSRQQDLELNAAVFARCEKIFLKALRGGGQLARETMLGLLEKKGISTAKQRGYHILWRLAQEGLLCFGAHDEKQPTFALLDEWCPAAAKSKDREESLAELAKRYFTSHGPATLQDFVGWSGLKISEARAGLEMNAATLVREAVEDKVYWMSRKTSVVPSGAPTAYLLPGFDEYMLGYKDRSPSLAPKYAERICPGSNGMFVPTIVVNGQVIGTWKRVLKKDTVAISLSLFSSLSKTGRRAVATYAKRYGQFVGKKATLTE